MIGCFGDSDEVTVVIGGNCFVQLFDMEGNERFWNIMSDQVSALALVDFDGDGHNHVKIKQLTYLSHSISNNSSSNSS